MSYYALTVSGIATAALIGFTVTNFDDIKLKGTRWWGYRTIENNPLLPSLDKDLQETDVTEPRIDLKDLLSGGPPKDGIPSIDRPLFTSAKDTPFLISETVLGIVLNGEAKAYPYGILNWHEIVNDSVGGIPLSITYCPLCDTGIAFERVIDGKQTTLGVSGKLYNSCLVLYDRATDTLWSQPWGIGIAGERVNDSLKRYPLVKTTLGKWIEQHPNTLVLSNETGYDRDYFRYPYGTYTENDRLIFPARNQEKIVSHPKDIETIYAEADSNIPLNEFSGVHIRFRNDDVREAGSIAQEFAGRTFEARWDSELESVRVFEEGKELPTTSSFGFVYPAFFE